MALSTFVDLVNVNTATTGAGTMTLGAAVSGWVGVGGLVNGLTYSYKITDETNYEAGVGVYTTSGTTMTRVVTESSNGGSTISLSGSATVILTVLAADLPDIGRVFQAGKLLSANFNSTADQSIALVGTTNAAGVSKWVISQIIIVNPSISLTTAKGAFYAAASKTGPLMSLIASSPYTGLVSASHAALIQPTNSATFDQGALYQTSASTTIFLSLTTAQGVAATADIYVNAIRLA